MSQDSDSLDTILALIKQMEATLLGLRQLRAFVIQGTGLEFLNSLVSECESKLEEVKRKLIQ